LKNTDRMHPDNLEYLAALSAIECGEEDRTRQEFRDECDINKIMRNLAGVPYRELTYGEVDFDALDRHQVENSLIEAKAVYGRLTPQQRQAIPSIAHLIQMAHEGYSGPPEAIPEAAPPASTPPAA